MLVTMKELLDKASAGNYAVAAPNVSNEINARACIEAAEEMKAPLILDVAYMAAVDVQFLGEQLRRLAEQSSVDIAINLDHGASLEQVMACIRAGFTSVMIDRSSCPDEENIRDVAEIVRVAHAVGVSVEAELGHVGNAMHYEEDRDAALTDPQFAREYIERTGVDCLAVAIGTAHGAYPKGFVPYLDFDRLAEIKKATDHFPLVLHGSSGTAPEDLRKACAMGINKVNINTDLCIAAMETAQVASQPDKHSFLLLHAIQNGIRDKLKEMIEIYGSAGKCEPDPTKGLPRMRLPRME